MATAEPPVKFTACTTCRERRLASPRRHRGRKPSPGPVCTKPKRRFRRGALLAAAYESPARRATVPRQARRISRPLPRSAIVTRAAETVGCPRMGPQPALSIRRHDGQIRLVYPSGGVNFRRQRGHRFFGARRSSRSKNRSRLLTPPAVSARRPHAAYRSECRHALDSPFACGQTTAHTAAARSRFSGKASSTAIIVARPHRVGRFRVGKTVNVALHRSRPYPAGTRVA